MWKALLTIVLAKDRPGLPKIQILLFSKHFPDGKPTGQFPNSVPAEVSSQVERGSLIIFLALSSVGI